MPDKTEGDRRYKADKMDRNRTDKRRKVKRKGFCGLKKTNDINTGDVQPEMGENSSDIHAQVGMLWVKMLVLRSKYHKNHQQT